MNRTPLTRKNLFAPGPIAALYVVVAAGCQQGAPTGTAASPPPPQSNVLPSMAHPVAQSSDVPPLIQAAQKGDADTVKTLISGGADVNAAASDGATALMRTSSTGVAKLLLDKGAKVDATDSRGN